MSAQSMQARERPQVLASTAPLLLSPLDWVFDVLAEAGYSGAELLLAHNPETRDPDAVLRRAAVAGLDVPVVHGPYMLLLRTVLGSSYRTKTRRALEIASQIGADVMVAHAPFRWERSARAWLSSEEPDAEGAELGVALGMENLFPVAGRAFSTVITPQDLRAHQHVVFDTSHFAIAGFDLFEAWELLSDRVVHLHVSDNYGNGKDSHAPIGAGVLPIERFLAHVGASGYRGTLTLELDCRAHLDSRQGLINFLAGERHKAEAFLVGEDPANRHGQPSLKA